MLRFSLKKQQKLDLLVRMLTVLPLESARCLLITNGDNNGALNFGFRRLGGRWQWAELDGKGIAAMESFLSEPVKQARPDALPFDDATFERVIAIDVHEHLPDPVSFNREIARVLAPGGLAIITTPNGNRRLPVAVLKRWIGMDERAYGHFVQGYEPEQLEQMLKSVGITPSARGAYSRFFTELVELAINFAYTRVLAKRNNGRAEHGEIAPRTESELAAVGGSYRFYRTVFPAIRMFSAMDRLIPGNDGYAVAVAGRKPA
jgi:SAM-dependent methyltransferase